jgi:hypothetical protein
MADEDSGAQAAGAFGLREDRDAGCDLLIHLISTGPHI